MRTSSVVLLPCTSLSGHVSTNFVITLQASLLCFYVQKLEALSCTSVRNILWLPLTVTALKAAALVETDGLLTDGETDCQAYVSLFEWRLVTAGLHGVITLWNLRTCRVQVRLLLLKKASNFSACGKYTSSSAGIKHTLTYFLSCNFYSCLKSSFYSAFLISGGMPILRRRDLFSLSGPSKV